MTLENKPVPCRQESGDEGDTHLSHVWHMCGGQRQLGELSFLVWVLGIELKLSGLAGAKCP